MGPVSTPKYHDELIWKSCLSPYMLEPISLQVEPYGYAFPENESSSTVTVAYPTISPDTISAHFRTSLPCQRSGLLQSCYGQHYRQDGPYDNA